ncbi:hypothetical protein RND71_005357 [Anisodus tanguticus]|uniref:Uncharacterized protein n=1 Tax=Anisodus tanguticus TaxID=243964 RepID=A0AAE1VVF7_9SOLA|nr:hypothetical protein RND71_005357 [Anisodus tanguticus]
MKDEQAGEVPVAFVVRSNGSTIIEDEVKDFVSKKDFNEGRRVLVRSFFSI